MNKCVAHTDYSMTNNYLTLNAVLFPFNYNSFLRSLTLDAQTQGHRAISNVQDTGLPAGGGISNKLITNHHFPLNLCGTVNRELA